MQTPVYFKLTTPTRLKFELAAGVYWSFLDDYDYYNPEYYGGAYNDVAYPGVNEPPKKDFGYLFAAGLSYPMNDNFRMYFNSQYFSGRRDFLTSKAGKNQLT